MAYNSQMQQIAKSIADNYARGAEYLQKRHDTTIAAASELKANLAALPLNEAENEWRNGIVNAIDEQLNMIDINGFKGYGFNEIVKATGDIASSPAMIGRLQAQKDFTDFQNEIKSRQDLTELDKEYFLTKNPYYYQDKFNDKGQIINGTKWQPTERALTRVDFTEILNRAAKWATPDAQGGTTVKFIDADGNETTDINSIKNAYYFNTITGESVYLSKEKIQEAIDAAIASTPGAAESLAQEYKIAVWAAENKGINDGIIGKDGMPISEKEFLSLKTNPFINAASYRQSKYSSTYEETELNKQRTRLLDNNGGIGNNLTLPQAFNDPSVQTSRGGIVEISTKDFKEHQLNADAAKSNINKLLNGKASINYNLEENDLKNSVIELFNNGTLDINNYDEVMANIRTITDANYEKEHIFSDATGNDKERHNFIELYSQGKEIDESAGSIGKRYNGLLSSVWKNPTDAGYSDSIGYILNNKEYNDFINRIGGENIMKQMGIKVKNDTNGNKIVTLNYDNKENTGSFIVTIGATWQNKGKGNLPMYRFDNNGNILTYKNPYAPRPQDNFDGQLAKFILKQQDKENKYLDKHPLYKSTTVIDAGSIEELKYRMAAQQDPENASDYFKLADEQQKNSVNSLINSDFNQYDIQIFDSKNGHFVDIDGKELEKLNKMINDGFRNTTAENTNYNIKVGFVQDELGNIKKLINIVDNKNPGKVYKYLQSVDNSSKDAINFKNDDTTISTKLLGQLNIYDKPIHLTGLNNFSIKLYNRYDNSNDNKYVIDYGNGYTSDILSRENVLELTEANVILDKMLDALSVGLINDANFYRIQSNKVANTYAKYGLVNYNNFVNQLLSLANM